VHQIPGEPNGARTIPAVIAAAAERFGDAEALVDGDRRWSFRQLLEGADRVARALVASGLRAGDRIGIWAPNSGDWVLAALGAYRAGLVIVTVNTRFKGAEAAHVLGTAEARLLLTVNGFLDTDYVAMLDEVGRPPSIEAVVLLDGPPSGGSITWDDLLARGDGDDRDALQAEVEARSAAVAPGDMSDILFTSGTTGKPKGAMLGHEASVAAFQVWADGVGLREGDRYLIVNPFFHTFGLKAGILACLLQGAVMVPHPVFDVPSVMRRVEEERITMLPGAPAIYQTILDHPDRAGHDLSSLRLAVTGAATVPVEMIRRMRDELDFEVVVTAYGLTETTGIVTMCQHDDPVEVIANTAGRAIPNTEVQVVGEDGKPVSAGEPGEVWVRGYQLMLGYFGDPAATAETIDAEGWLHTGDIGVMDEAGNLKITDRTKDMFICGGFNAYPAEIEGMIMRHPAVSQVAVVGVPDHRLGEVGKAFVVLRPGAADTWDEAAFLAWCRDEMANYKAPRSVEVVDALPLNASGKVLKYVLRDGVAG
jgi:acyl-CoA synthetase (AMP-forming)/AMP-acid ligase II